MSRERRCWPYRECPYTKFSILTYAKREEPLKLICAVRSRARTSGRTACTQRLNRRYATGKSDVRSEEHTSELQSLAYLVCRLLLEKKKNRKHSLILSK